MNNPLNISRFEEKKQQVKEYLGTPRKMRMPLPTFRKAKGIRRNEFLDMKHTIETEQRELARINVRNIQENLLKGLGDEFEDDPVGWWKARTLELNEAILQSAKKGNAQSQKLAKQLAGELVEKQEVTIGRSPEEIYRSYLQEQRELAEFRDRLGSGTEKVPE